MTLETRVLDIETLNRELEIKRNRKVMAQREQAEVLRLAKLAGKTRAADLSLIFNPAVPMANRAKFVDQSHWNTVKDWDALCNNVDGLILKVGGMDISDGKGALKAYEDVDWPGAVQQAYDHKKRIEAYFYCHPNYHLLKQRSLDWVRNQPYQTNEVLIQLITSLHNGAWTWDNLTADRGWKPIEAIWFDLEETQAWNGKITPQWQQVTLENLIDPMMRLQDMGKIPASWKIGVYTRPLFLRDDCKNADGSNPVETYLYNRRERLLLWLAQWIFPLDPDIQVTSLAQIWEKYIPADTFKFLHVPAGYENRIWHHQYTGEKFDTPEYTPEVDANLHMDTVQEYDKATGFVPGTTPEPPVPPVPPVDDPDLAVLTLRVKAIEDILRAGIPVQGLAKII